MARVKVTHDHIVEATPSVNVFYRAGAEVVAPRAHIDEIVAAKHGERVPAPAAGEPDSPESETKTEDAT